ncbi:MAG: KUP/HAK/KT family potassium transporter, partial [Caldilineaceae bacterium]
LFVVAREQWNWPLYTALGLTVLFLIVDLAFWGANLSKIPAGGWFPLVIGAAVFVLMTTWKRGREILAQRLRAGTIPFAEFIEQIYAEDPVRVQGTAVFMSSNPKAAPPALLHNWRHNHILHQRVILLSVHSAERPRVPRSEKVSVEELGDGFYQIILSFGFMETPNVPLGLRLARHKGLELGMADISYFLGRERLYATSRPGMAIWREKLFALMSRNAISATDFFRLPPNQVVELGTLVEL